MIFAASILLTVGVLVFVLFVRDRDLPESHPASPDEYLEQRRAVVYDNLRDLNFEFRLGKLSETDYQQSKLALEAELAQVLSALQRVSAPATAEPPETKVRPAAAEPTPCVCPHCHARFDRPLKFCGECGKPMAEARS